jgi:hypothetical protein
MSPFSALRDWIHAASKLVRNTSRPYLIQWIEKDVLRIAGLDITKDQLSAFYNERLDYLEKLVSEKILFGISLDALGITCQFPDNMDNGDIVTPGHGPFPMPTDPKQAAADVHYISNEESEKFFTAMEEKGCLGLSASDEELTFDKNLSLDWLSSIHEAECEAYPLSHTTIGLPGRGTEEAMMNYANTPDGRRHLFGMEESLAILSNYHKGTFYSGTYKFILRLFCYRLARLRYIITRIVRPIEVVVLSEFVVKPDKKEKMMEDYRTKLFTSWGRAWTADDMSAALMAWFKAGVGHPIGIRLYRHIAIAMQEHYLDYSVKDANPLADAAARQAGHTRTTREHDYAITHGSTGYSQAGEKEYIRVSKDWHKLFGLETYFSSSK